MFIALGHLALRSWFAMVAALSTNTLGFVTSVFGLSFCIWLVGLAYEWITVRDLKTAMKKSLRFLVIDFAGASLFLFIALPIFAVRTVYFDHNGLRWNLIQDQTKIKALELELARRQHILSPADSVYFDVNHLMTAFRIFKNDMHGESCVVRLTAPKAAEAYAQMISSFSIAVDNCTTFGPMLSDMDPDEAADTNIGMVADAIVFHARRDDKAADALFNELGNQVRLIRSYDTGRANYQAPPGGYKHVVWLQLGANVKWNSERY